MSHRPGRRLVTAAAATLATALLLAPAGAQASPPTAGAYQDDDGLGFRNILPPGQNGFATLPEISTFLFGGGARPPHNNDQLDEYDDIVQAAPGLTEDQVDGFYKDASFGVQGGDVDETYTPDCAIVSEPSVDSAHCDDVTIVRDAGAGVPHVYGADRAALMFGAGYVGAEDRLFFMDVVRHLGRADLSSFLGGSNAATDRSTWRDAPYNEADLQQQFDDADDNRGAEGLQVQADVQNYVDGINQYIAEARDGPAVDQALSTIPGEYYLTNHPAGPDEWQVTDVIATALVVAGQFGKGGGGEVGNALVLEKAVAEFGAGDGRDVFDDFRSREDTEAPTTVHDGTPFPYGVPPASPDDVALPDPGTTVQEPIVAGPPPPPKAKAAQPPPFKGLLDLEGASNALLVSDAESEGDHPLAVMGPQVGYFSPQILTEIDMHAPTTGEGLGIDARGAAFAGINLYVLLGRGQDYAWSATSAGQDIIDTYAVELCDPGNPGDLGDLSDDGYRFDGGCEPFEVLERVNAWSPSAADSTPTGGQTLHSLRTKVGIVSHRAEIGGVPYAYTKLRATYMHEADSAVGFAAFNQPSTMEDVDEFKAAAAQIDNTFNWFYADPEKIAYFNSGANPVRPANVDPNLPVRLDPDLGETLDNAWSNFDPASVSFDRAPAAAHPQVVDQDYITSWNNKQAPDYSAADEKYSFGPVQRVESLDERVEAGIAGAETMTRAELVDAMEDAATVDLRGSQVLPVALKVVKTKLNKAKGKKKLKKAIKTLKKWNKAGAHRRDSDGDGVYEDTKAVRIMDAWWPRLVAAQFEDELGSPLYAQIQTMMGLDNAPGASGSAYISGWYGYVDKDLRSVLGDPVDSPYSREYCGGGKLKKCAKALQGSLRKALANDDNATLYPGFPNTACNNQVSPVPSAQWCKDSIRATTIGGISQPPIHWQNRPTFQQVVEPQNAVP
ncbi:MAG: penicillin acylase family protein [bacterium]